MRLAARRETTIAILVRGLLFGFSVFCVSLIGIYSVPHLGLAGFWPANAFVLGMLVRFPRLNQPFGWVCCISGFAAGDLVSGSEFIRNLLLNGGNLISVAVGTWLMGRLPEQDRLLKGAYSTLYLMRTILLTSLVLGLVGMVVNPVLFLGPRAEGFIFWTATEMVNYVTFLPVILTIPRKGFVRRPTFGDRSRATKVLMPVAALVLSSSAAALIDGPGAVAFAVPALMWCALAYDLFVMSCISLMFAMWTLIALRTGIIWTGADFNSRELLISARIGVSLVAFTPLVVASVLAARNELLSRLRYLADHDALTGALNRRAFLDIGGRILQAQRAEGEVVTTVMMLDIDHFKAVNDRYGHKAGDEVLISFCSSIRPILHDRDMFARMGGEEFAILLPDCDKNQAVTLARHINEALRGSPVKIENGMVIRITVSIGIHTWLCSVDLEESLHLADEALYRAKRLGRDRFETSPATGRER